MMGRSSPPDCRRHASALLDLVDPLTPTPGSAAAMDHLEWCRRCSDELQDLALAIVALRRYGEADDAQPASPTAWPNLSARIVSTRAAAAAAAWRWRASVAGLAAGTLVVAALVGPLALHVPLAGGVDEPTGYSQVELEGRARRVEAAYIWQSNVGSFFRAPTTVTAPESVGLRRYPDDFIPEWKEVQVRTTGRPPKAD